MRRKPRSGGAFLCRHRNRVSVRGTKEVPSTRGDASSGWTAYGCDGPASFSARSAPSRSLSPVKQAAGPASSRPLCSGCADPLLVRAWPRGEALIMRLDGYVRVSKVRGRRGERGELGSASARRSLSLSATSIARAARSSHSLLRRAQARGAHRRPRGRRAWFEHAALHAQLGARLRRVLGEAEHVGPDRIGCEHVLPAVLRRRGCLATHIVSDLVPILPRSRPAAPPWARARP